MKRIYGLPLIVTFVSSQLVKADVRSGIGRNEISQEVINGTPRIFSYYGRSIALSEGDCLSYMRTGQAMIVGSGKVCLEMGVNRRDTYSLSIAIRSEFCEWPGCPSSSTWEVLRGTLIAIQLLWMIAS